MRFDFDRKNEIRCWGVILFFMIRNHLMFLLEDLHDRGS